MKTNTMFAIVAVCAICTVIIACEYREAMRTGRNVPSLDTRFGTSLYIVEPTDDLTGSSVDLSPTIWIGSESFFGGGSTGGTGGFGGSWEDTNRNSETNYYTSDEFSEGAGLMTIDETKQHISDMIEQRR